MRSPDRTETVAFKVNPKIRALIEAEALEMQGSISQVLRRIVYNHYQGDARQDRKPLRGQPGAGLRHPEASSPVVQES